DAATSSSAEVADAGAPIAVVAAVSGEVSLTEPDRPKRPVQRFDWLSSGAFIQMGEGSRATLAFATGSRYDLGPQATGRLAPGGFPERTGAVTELASVPPLPAIRFAAPLRAERAMAVRVRGERIKELYPAGAATVLADAAVLRFSAVPGAEAYRVEIES